MSKTTPTFLTVASGCARFCSEWNGDDAEEGARVLLGLLPPRIPGALRLVIARALRDLDVPPFASPAEFREAVGRFARPTPLDSISDVRRARRESRLTLGRIARETAVPIAVLRQLEWGDFRDWRDDAWMRRVIEAYARAAALDVRRVRDIVYKEWTRQLDELADRALARPLEEDRETAPAIAPVRSRLHHQMRTAAAAVVAFAFGMVAGAAVVDRDRATSAPPAAVEAVPAPPGASEVAPARPADGSARPLDLAAPPDPVTRPDPGARPDNLPRRSDRLQASAAATEGTTGAVPTAAAMPAPAAPQPPPRLHRALNETAPAFSPSFSREGTAVFYHRDNGSGSALMKAEPGGAHAVSLIDDGARNYHVKPSPDGSHIAFDSDRDGERGVYVADADGRNVRRVSGPGFAAVPSWSPDGSRLTFVRGESRSRSRVWNLWLLDLASAATIRLTSYNYGQPWGASWFPDGRRLAYSHEDRLTVLNIETGARRLFRSPLPGRLLRTPAVSPNGRHVAFQVHRDGAWLLDLENGSMRRILADPTAEEFAWDAAGRRLAFHSRRSGVWSVWIMSGPES